MTDSATRNHVRHRGFGIRENAPAAAPCLRMFLRGVIEKWLPIGSVIRLAA